MIIAICILGIVALGLSFFLYKLYQRNQELAKFQTSEGQIIELKNQISSLISEKYKLYEENKTLLSENGLLKSEKSVEERMKEVFKLTSTDIIKHQSEDFKKISSDEISKIINPFKENLNKLESTLKEDNQKLNKELTLIGERSKDISEKANNLADALRGNKKLQGNWGEQILKNLLNNSGMTAGKDYIEQPTMISSDGSTIRPDFQVFLPNDTEKKSIIVDSKCPLSAYQDYYNSVDDETKAQHLKQLVINTKLHVDKLTSYLNSKDINTIDCIFLFVPIDFISLLLETDASLLDYAWKKKIAIVAPNTLFSALKIIDYLWRMDKQNKNTFEIIKTANFLYEQFEAFLVSLKKVEKDFTKTKEDFDDMIKRAEHGRGNLIRGFEAMRKVGGLTPKKIIEADANITNTKEETISPKKDLLGNNI